MLVPAYPDTKWFQTLFRASTELRFVTGRLNFVGGKHGARFPNAVFLVDTKHYRERSPTVGYMPKRIA
jgi:hypothetical protein